MAPRIPKSNRQPYPREIHSLIAAHNLFPPHKPPLSDKVILKAIDVAFDRARRNRVGKFKKVSNTPEELVKLCIKHLKTRSCPILGPFFYSQCAIEEIFDLDAIPHEMQRQRMNIGIFYQYLIIELMRAASKMKKSSIEAVFDGSNEGDVVADIKTPRLKSGLRVYASIKKSADTVGGQDVPGVVRRLEAVAKAEKNITRPYLCVFCYATPYGGKIHSYKDSRSVKYNNEGHPFSENCESWEPGFIFPYICGRSAIDIYKLSITKVGNYLPFFTVQYRKECAQLIKKKFMDMGLVKTDGALDEVKFIKFIAEE